MAHSRRPARKKVTIKDVAQHAGVSLTAASYALSGRDGKGPSGSPETRALVERAARDLGYIPNQFARAMRLGHSDSIVLALGTVADPWGIALTQAVRTKAQPYGQSTVLLADEGWYEFLTRYPSDCAFITSIDWDPEGHDKVQRLARNGLRIVAFSETLEASYFDVISSPAGGAIRSAYRRLKDRHDHVHFMARTPANTHTLPFARHAVFADEARKAGDERSATSIIFAGLSAQSAYDSALEALSAPAAERPTAIIGSTAYIALAVQAAANRVGIHTPGDLEIISIGDVPNAAALTEPLSFYGVHNVFERIADTIVQRALKPSDTDFAKHTFAWEFFPGATTKEPWSADHPPQSASERFEI